MALSVDTNVAEFVHEPLYAGSLINECWMSLYQFVEGQLLDGLRVVALGEIGTQFSLMLKLLRELLLIAVNVLPVVVLDVVEEPFGVPGVRERARQRVFDAIAI